MIVTILERRLILTSESQVAVEEYLLQIHAPRYTPRYASRSIKVVLYERLLEQVSHVLSKWEALMLQPAKQNFDWAASFCVLSILVLLSEKMIELAFFRSRHRVQEDPSREVDESRDCLELVQLLEQKIFSKFKETFHRKFGTRGFNPVRDGFAPSEQGQVTNNTLKLVEGIQNIMNDYSKTGLSVR